jgi:hypothetical protein
MQQVRGLGFTVPPDIDNPVKQLPT